MVGEGKLLKLEAGRLRAGGGPCVPQWAERFRECISVLGIEFRSRFEAALPWAIQRWSTGAAVGCATGPGTHGKACRLMQADTPLVVVDTAVDRFRNPGPGNYF